VLQVWFPGMEYGAALADVLLGEVNPSGRLPMTIPRRLEDTPSYLSYPGEGGRVLYGEGVFVGYRGFDARDVEPHYPFGYGLSYTTFELGPLRVESVEGCRVEVSIEVTNTGPIAGAEVVQLYVADVAATVARPPKELVAFAKVQLDPGEATTVHFSLGERAFAYWDPATGGSPGAAAVHGALRWSPERAAPAPAALAGTGWRVEPGRFDLLAGTSSRHLPSRASVALDP
jgi:beta-glucosidase